jgi:hypothetical protein
MRALNRNWLLVVPIALVVTHLLLLQAGEAQLKRGYALGQQYNLNYAPFPIRLDYMINLPALVSLHPFALGYPLRHWNPSYHGDFASVTLASALAVFLLWWLLAVRYRYGGTALRVLFLTYLFIVTGVSFLFSSGKRVWWGRGSPSLFASILWLVLASLLLLNYLRRSHAAGIRAASNDVEPRKAR